MLVNSAAGPTGEYAAARNANQTSFALARRAMDVTRQQGEAAVELIRAVGRTREALSANVTPNSPSTRSGSLDVIA